MTGTRNNNDYASALDDYEVETFTHDEVTKAVFRLGTGPAVIVISEMPGITPAVAEFGRRVAAIGCTAVLPHLFGQSGRPPTKPGKSPGDKPRSDYAYMASTVVRACVAKEFTVWATGRTSPVVDWLRALARHEHQRCGGPGVGAVGMCFTGGFALAMATDDVIQAAVAAQPSLPFAFTPSRRRTIDLSDEDMDTVAGRCQAGLPVIGLRFEGDSAVPGKRFRFLEERLGSGFLAIELPEGAANPDAAMPPHSTLTEHLVDEPGSPTRIALDQVLDLFRRQLLAH